LFAGLERVPQLFSDARRSQLFSDACLLLQLSSAGLFLADPSSDQLVNTQRFIRFRWHCIVAIPNRPLQPPHGNGRSRRDIDIDLPGPPRRCR
jgi:hypothetical protein